MYAFTQTQQQQTAGLKKSLQKNKLGIKKTCSRSDYQIHVIHQEAELFLLWENQQTNKKRKKRKKRTEIKTRKILKNLKTRISD